MLIKNSTSRTLEFTVSTHESQTVWSGSVDTGRVATKEDLPDVDIPFTLFGRWPNDPPLKYVWMPYPKQHNVPNSSSKVEINGAYPDFGGTVS